MLVNVGKSCPSLGRSGPKNAACVMLRVLSLRLRGYFLVLAVGCSERLFGSCTPKRLRRIHISFVRPVNVKEKYKWAMRSEDESTLAAGVAAAAAAAAMTLSPELRHV